MIQLKDEEKKQIISCKHHMGLWATNFEDVNGQRFANDNSLTEHDIIAESLDYKLSATGAGAFKLGASDVTSVSFDFFRNNNVLTEKDLTGATFDLYITNKLTSGESYLDVRSDFVGNYGEVDEIVDIGSEYNGTALRVRVTWGYVDEDYSLEYGDAKTLYVTCENGKLRVCSYAVLTVRQYTSVFDLRYALIEVFDDSGDEPVLIVGYTVSGIDIRQCTVIHLGNFTVEQCPYVVGQISRSITAYDTLPYEYFDKPVVSYDAGETVRMYELLEDIRDAGLLPIDLSNHVETYTDFAVADTEETQEYKISGLPEGGTVTITLGKSTLSKTAPAAYNQVSIALLIFYASSSSHGARTAINNILGSQGLNVDDLLLNETIGLNAVEWQDAYLNGSTNTVKYLRDNINKILHAQPDIVWAKNSADKYTVSADFWRIIGASYSGTILADRAQLMAAWQPFYASDLTGKKIDDDDYFVNTDTYSNGLILSGPQQPVERTFSGRAHFAGRDVPYYITVTRVRLVPQILIGLEPAPTPGTVFASYWTTTSEWMDYYDALMVAKFNEFGYCNTDGEFNNDADQEAYEVVWNAVKNALEWIHTTYYPNATYEEGGITYRYNPIDMVFESRASEYAEVYAIDDIHINGLGHLTKDAKLVELTDNPDSQTGFIYFPRDKEVEELILNSYTGEPLANLQFKADTGGTITYRQALAAYAELKGKLYDSLNKRLVSVALGLYPEAALYPSATLYPQDGGNVQVIDSSLFGTFPALDIFPSDDLYPMYMSQLAMIRKLEKYRFDNPLRYKGLRMETPEGWTADVIKDPTHPNDEIYEISNAITTNFEIVDKDEIYNRIWAVLYGEEFKSYDIETVGLPWMQIGDFLSIVMPDETITLFLYDKELKGIQAPVDIIKQIIKRRN